LAAWPRGTAGSIDSARKRFYFSGCYSHPLPLGEGRGWSRGFVAHGGAGVSRGTASRLRNGIALQGNTPLPRLRNGIRMQANTRTASEGIGF